MKEKRTIIACGIFRDELEEALKDEKRFDLDVIWLKPGFHVRTDLLAAKMAELLGELDEERRRGLRVFLGRNCLLSFESAKVDFRVLPTDNCLTAMVGLPKLRELEANRTMVVTPAWIREIYLARDPELMIWDEAEFRMNFGRYDRLLVLEAGLAPLTDEETLAAFDLAGSIVETCPITLDFFKSLTKEYLT
ncbi:MAG: DUF1638 domain-containing protein [Deltaproteobacteria bacterium]|jgi:hypothetical protein|nr:DUF1638 domain-containing protein [Deltaproteobacteria bacterium]